MIKADWPRCGPCARALFRCVVRRLPDDPQSVVPENIMPKYAFLSDVMIEGGHIEALFSTHRFVGVPYTDE